MSEISANNQILVDRKTFKIYHVDVDCYADRRYRGKPIGRGKTFEEAVDMANDFLTEYEPVEYSIATINTEKKGLCKNS